jgi:hypothetical protein
MCWAFSRKIKGSDCTVVLAHLLLGPPRDGRPSDRPQAARRSGHVKVAQQDHESECCGFGGTFSIKQPEISGAMVEDKVKALKATGAERVVSADCGCLMNILGHAAWKDEQEGRKTPSLPGEHIASFLLPEDLQMSARDRILAKLKAAPVLPKAAPMSPAWYAPSRHRKAPPTRQPLPPLHRTGPCRGLFRQSRPAGCKNCGKC